MNTTPNAPHQLPATIKTKEVLALFEALGSEMQHIPAQYRNAVFTKLRKRRAFLAEQPTSQPGIHCIDAFMTAWMNYP